MNFFKGRNLATLMMIFYGHFSYSENPLSATCFYFGGQRAVFMLSSQYTINTLCKISRISKNMVLLICINLKLRKKLSNNIYLWLLKSIMNDRHHSLLGNFQIPSKKSLKRHIHFGADMIISWLKHFNLIKLTQFFNIRWNIILEAKHVFAALL